MGQASTTSAPTNADILRYAFQATDGFKALPEELKDPKAYALGLRPIFEWKEETIRYAVGSFMPQIKRPEIDRWLLGPDTYKGTALALELRIQIAAKTKNAGSSRSIDLPSRSVATQNDWPKFTEFLGSLTNEQRRDATDPDKGIPLSTFNKKQIGFLRGYMPVSDQLAGTGSLFVDYEFYVLVKHGGQNLTAPYPKH
jgi:hypothetical protein